MDLAKVERVYTSYAKIYDRIFGKVFNEGRQSVIRNLNVQPDEKILEVGTLAGYSTIWMARGLTMDGELVTKGDRMAAVDSGRARNTRRVENDVDVRVLEFFDSRERYLFCLERGFDLVAHLGHGDGPVRDVGVAAGLRRPCPGRRSSR